MPSGPTNSTVGFLRADQEPLAGSYTALLRDGHNKALYEPEQPLLRITKPKKVALHLLTRIGFAVKTPLDAIGSLYNGVSLAMKLPFAVFKYTFGWIRMKDGKLLGDKGFLKDCGLVELARHTRNVILFIVMSPVSILVGLITPKGSVKMLTWMGLAPEEKRAAVPTPTQKPTPDPVIPDPQPAPNPDNTLPLPAPDPLPAPNPTPDKKEEKLTQEKKALMLRFLPLVEKNPELLQELSKSEEKLKLVSELLELGTEKFAEKYSSSSNDSDTELTDSGYVSDDSSDSEGEVTARKFETLIPKQNKEIPASDPYENTVLFYQAINPPVAPQTEEVSYEGLKRPFNQPKDQHNPPEPTRLEPNEEELQPHQAQEVVVEQVALPSDGINHPKIPAIPDAPLHNNAPPPPPPQDFGSSSTDGTSSVTSTQSRFPVVNAGDVVDTASRKAFLLLSRIFSGSDSSDTERPKTLDLNQSLAKSVRKDASPQFAFKEDAEWLEDKNDFEEENLKNLAGALFKAMIKHYSGERQSQGIGRLEQSPVIAPVGPIADFKTYIIVNKMQELKVLESVSIYGADQAFVDELKGALGRRLQKAIQWINNPNEAFQDLGTVYKLGKDLDSIKSEIDTILSGPCPKTKALYQMIIKKYKTTLAKLEKIEFQNIDDLNRFIGEVTTVVDKINGAISNPGDYEKKLLTFIKSKALQATNLFAQVQVISSNQRALQFLANVDNGIGAILNPLIEQRHATQNTVEVSYGERIKNVAKNLLQSIGEMESPQHLGWFEKAVKFLTSKVEAKELLKYVEDVVIEEYQEYKRSEYIGEIKKLKENEFFNLFSNNNAELADTLLNNKEIQKLCARDPNATKVLKLISEKLNSNYELQIIGEKLSMVTLKT